MTRFRIPTTGLSFPGVLCIFAIVKSVLIFTGFNTRAVIAFLRTLVARDVHFVLVASSPEDPIFETDYGEGVVITRPDIALDQTVFRSIFNEVTKRHPDHEFLIAPTSEALNRFLLVNPELYEGGAFTLPLAGQETYLCVSDKLPFIELCQEFDLPVPEAVSLASEGSFPIVAKPRYYIGEHTGAYLKPEILESESDVDAFRRNHDEREFIYQAFVDGHSFYLLMYLPRRGNPTVISQENLVQQPGGASILAAEISYIHERIDWQTYAEALRQVGFHGLIMIELRGRDGDYRMIEANPRFWGPSQLFVDAGCNLFEALLADYGLLPSRYARQPKPAKCRYFWDDGHAFNGDEIDRLAFHRITQQAFLSDYAEWDAYNLFDRPDTRALYTQMTENSTPARRARLRRLYEQSSKHSGYQSLAPSLTAILGASAIDAADKYENERLAFIQSHVSFENKRVVDVGGNTGFFALTAAETASRVDYFEGNADHAAFVDEAVSALGLGERVNVHASYLEFDDLPETRYDVMLLLNVLHHVGDDFGDGGLSLEQAHDQIIRDLRAALQIAEVIVFQLGFNWQGNVAQPLFAGGTKAEMISFIKSGINDLASLTAIGIATGTRSKAVYEPVDDANLARRDDLGEFLNRPIFILERK